MNKIKADLSAIRGESECIMTDFEKKEYPRTIAEKIMELTSICMDSPNGDDEQETEELTDCLYQLLAAAENPYNADYYRRLYRRLEALVYLSDD